MYDRIAPVLAYFTRINFFVDAIKTNVKTESQGELLWLFNEGRKSLNKGPIDRGNLHHRLKAASPASKRDLLYCLGLDELGFGPSI